MRGRPHSLKIKVMCSQIISYHIKGCVRFLFYVILGVFISYQYNLIQVIVQNQVNVLTN